MSDNIGERPVIGLVPLVDDERESFWMLPGYMGGVIEAGGIPIMLPLTSDECMIDRFMDMCSGFLLTGGQDVSPAIYGVERTDKCGECCRQRDEMEGAILRRAVKADKSVLGICRGIQFMNAYLGGTLYQDICTEYETKLNHHQSPPYDIPVHEVELIKGRPLHRLLKTDRLSVNSYHHQCVKEVASCLKTMAVAEDGLVEGIYMPGKRFIWGVQWHPEFSYKADDNSMLIFREFIKSCITVKE